MCQEKNHSYTNTTLTLLWCRHNKEGHIILKMRGITKIQKNTSLVYVHLKMFQGYDTYRVIIKNKWRSMPPNKFIIESKWVFKKKRDSQFRARLVVRGYIQIPGVDLTNNYSPVVTDITLCVILCVASRRSIKHKSGVRPYKKDSMMWYIQGIN